MAGNGRLIGSREPIGDTDLSDALFRFAYSRVRDRHIAEDLTHEVLLRAARKRSSLRDSDRMSGWLFRIARNVVADYFRRARPTVSYNETLHGTGEREEHGACAREEDLLRRQLARYVRGVVDDLPRIYREALILTEYEGLTQVELARRAGISVSAAKSRVQRARVKVRREIEACCRVRTDVYGTVLDCRPRGRSGGACRSPAGRLESNPTA